MGLKRLHAGMSEDQLGPKFAGSERLGFFPHFLPRTHDFGCLSKKEHTHKSFLGQPPMAVMGRLG